MVHIVFWILLFAVIASHRICRVGVLGGSSWISYFWNFTKEINYYCGVASYSATRLTVATQQTFLQVSQSGYTNVIDGHASLQSWRVKIILSSERFGLGR